MNKNNFNIMITIIHACTQKSILRWLVLGVMFLFLSNDMSATHIVGGDFTYTRLDDGSFEIKLTIRRDCANGQEEFDTLANIFLYNEYGDQLDFTSLDGWANGNLKIPYMGSDTINEVLISDCGFEGDQVCVHEANYIDTISLPPNFDYGYFLAYERCCRNGTLNNIVEPLNTGTTEYIEIPKLAFTDGNSSPRFNSWPDLYICEGEALSFDHSATDPDGDELRYKLYVPLSGASELDPLALEHIEDFPPLPVEYISPYSLTDFMGGVPLEIDEFTGLITATPNAVGQYLIGVKVEEYRDGVKIGETRRNFQYNVRICADPPMATFEAPTSLCDGDLEVSFTNESTGALIYQWNFDYPNSDPAFISNEENPTFIFPEEGTYTVQLQAFRGTDECMDEYFQDITIVTADIDANFQVAIGECFDDNNITISLNSTSVDNTIGYDIVESVWTVDQGGNIQIATGQSTNLDVDLGGDDLLVTLLVTSSSGCTAEATQTIILDDLIAIGDFSYTAEGCPSPEILQFTLTDLSSGLNPDYTPVSWAWTIVSTDGTEVLSGPSVSLTLDPFQVINATLVVEFDNGCLVTVIKDINLEDSLPEADFSAIVLTCMENGIASFEFEDISNAIPGNPSNPTGWSWTITFMDGTVLNSDEKIVNFDANSFQTVTVELTVNFENGCIANIEREINLADLLPMADYTLTPESCLDDGTVDIVITDVSTNTNGVEPVTIDWMIGPISNIQSYMGTPLSLNIPKDSLIYITQIVSFNNGCIDTLIEQIIPGPFAVLNFTGVPVIACAGAEVPLLINPNPDFTYTFEPTTGLDFSNGDHDPLFVGTVDMTYSVTVSDGLCSVEGSVEVVLEDAVELTITGENLSCFGIVELVATGGLGEGVYEWTLENEPNNVIFEGDSLITTFEGDSETYVVNYTSVGCPAIAGTFTVSQLAVDIELFEPYQICAGDSIQYVVLNNDPDQILTFEWEDNIHITGGNDTDMPIIEVGIDETEPFGLPFTVTNQIGCTLMDTLNVVISEIPVLTFNSTLTECGELEVCFDIPVNFFGFPIWDFGDETTTDDTSLDMTPCYTYPDFGTYTVTLSNISGICQAEPVTMEIQINPLIVLNELADITVCEDEEVTLIADTNLPVEDYTVTWCNEMGDTLFVGNEYVFTPESDMVVSLKVSDVNGCSASQLINVNVFDFDIEVFFPEVFCGDTEVPVTVTNNSDGDLTYIWGPEDCIVSGGDTDEPVLIASTDNKTFTVQVSNAVSGCTMGFEYDIPVTQFDIDIQASPDSTINLGEDVDIFLIGSEDGDTFEWSNGNTDESQTVIPMETTTYIVTVTDDNGCTDTAEITINVRQPKCDETDVYIPNAFTPNDDGVNDILYLRSNFIESMELSIYNRWGDEVFYTTDQSVGWDGTLGDEKLVPDAYAYILDVVCINAVEYRKQGNVTILR